MQGAIWVTKAQDQFRFTAKMSLRGHARVGAPAIMPDTRLRAVVDTALDGIILMDTGGSVTMFNPACERMFGYSAGEIIGGDVKVLMPPPYHGEHDRYLDNYRKTGRKKIIGIGREVFGRRKTGETFPLDLSVGAAEENGAVFYVGILRDVSERNRASDLRELLIEQLTASNMELARFGHVASHDMREPLRMIAAFCGLLSKNYGDRLDEQGSEYLSLAVSAATHMQDLLDDLVDFGRLGLEAERGSWFESRENVDRALEDIQEPIRASGAEITCGDLPLIFGNPIRFNRLMQNLVGNALKYVGPDVAPRVHIWARQTGDFWTFSVADNGIGIEARHYDQIFEPFKRLHAKSRYYGTGLGLAICRKIVDGFGGAIGVTSTPGEGSIFTFTMKVHSEGSDDGRVDH
jgi:PAS domain S-box-containing protein